MMPNRLILNNEALGLNIFVDQLEVLADYE